jgi:acyl-CoA dehydrogenase family protein 9
MDEEQRRLAEELLFEGGKEPSFGKKLYFGIFDAHKVFPFPELSHSEQKKAQEFAETVAAFVEKEIDPDAIDRSSSIPDSVVRGLGQLGVLGMTIPEKWGGLGMSQYAYCLVAEKIAYRCASTALFVNAHQSIGLKALLLFGTEEQKRRWLSPLSRGDSLAAFALTEPNAGSDAAGIETKAIFIPEKNVWRINGRKQWITNGAIAKILTVMALTEVDTPQGRKEKVTAFLVTPDMPGFKVLAPALEKVGMRGSKTANLEFDNLEVPADNILGPLGGGLKVCLTVLDYGRTTFGATCTGAAKFCLEKAIEHAKNRYQFKRPLASFSLVKKKIATMAALIYAMEATTYMTAGLVDAHVEDFMLEAAMLKVFCSDALWKILYETMQIFGGRSFFTDHPFERMMRDARLNMIGEGSNEVMRAFIGAVGLRDVGVQLKNTLDALKNPIEEFDILRRFVKQRWKSLNASTVPVVSRELKTEALHLGKAVRSFGYQVVQVLGKYREEILEKQLILDRLANEAMAIYTTTAVLSKLDADLRAKSIQPHAFEAGKLYCQMAFSTIDENRNALFCPMDDALEALSDQLTKKASR